MSLTENQNIVSPFLAKSKNKKENKTLDNFLLPEFYDKINDPMGISFRLTEIDPHYVLVFNKLKKRVEVHNTSNKDNTLSVVCPYDKIDTRLLTLVRQTRKERSEELIKEIEASNEKLEKSNTETITDNARQRVKELLKTKLKKEY